VSEGERDARIVQRLIAAGVIPVVVSLVARPLFVHAGMFGFGRLRGTGKACAVQWLRLARGVPGLRMHQVAGGVVLMAAVAAAAGVLGVTAVLTRRPAGRHAVGAPVLVPLVVFDGRGGDTFEMTVIQEAGWAA